MMSTFQFNPTILDAAKEFRTVYSNYFAMHQRLSDENYFYPYISCEKYGLLRTMRGHCIFDGDRWIIAAELVFHPQDVIFVATGLELTSSPCLSIWFPMSWSSCPVRP